MVMIQKNISFGVLTLHRKLGNVYKNYHYSRVCALSRFILFYLVYLVGTLKNQLVFENLTCQPIKRQNCFFEEQYKKKEVVQFSSSLKGFVLVKFSHFRTTFGYLYF